MKFVLIVDTKQSNQKIIDFVDDIICSLNKSTKNIHLVTYFLNDGMCLESDTEILIKMLCNESQRCPVFLDSLVAKYYPEIIKRQPSIVLMDHTTENGIDESVATAHGARILYANMQYHDDNDVGMLSIVNFRKYIATNEYIQYLAKMFYNEHNKYPVLLLPRFIQNDCGNIDELIEKYANRLQYIEYINWVSSNNHNVIYDEINDYCKFVDNAIHSLSDSRLTPRLYRTSKIYNKNV